MQQQQLRCSSGRFYLRGQQLRVSISAGPDALTAEVESAGRLWAGEFSAAYLEELARKTGSFKRYDVFAGMLVSAVGEQQLRTNKKRKQDEAEQLSLDLMTLDDLRALRAQRLGDDSNATTPRGGGESSGGGKRYLILTYRTRFDQVHYPLALAHQGRVSRVAADDQDRDRDVDAAADSDVNGEQNGGELARSLAAENARLRAELAQLRRQFSTTEAVSARRKREADELRNGERLLRLRLRQLTHELALMRRAPPQPSLTPLLSGSPLGRRPRPASAGNSPSPSPRGRDKFYNSQQQQQQQFARNQRRRSPSPRPPPAPLSARQHRAADAVQLHRDVASSARQQRRRPRSNSCPRFDPTAYVADLERRRRESRESRRRDIADRIRLAGAPSPSPSVASASSRFRVDGDDYDDDGDDADSLRLGSFDLLASASPAAAPLSLRRRQSRQRQPRSSARRRTVAAATAATTEGYEEDIQQIDERLDRLQSFLNKTLLIH